MAHLFSPSNPTLLIQDGLIYFIGRAGLCTQLSPIPAGYGNGGTPQNGGAGGPNTGASGQGPYTPPYAPFPGGFGLGLHNFSVIFAENGGVPQNGAYGTGIVVGFNPNGSLPVNGATGALVIGGLLISGSSGSIDFCLAIPKTYSATQPFTVYNQFFNTIKWTDRNGTAQTITSQAAHFTKSSNTLYWYCTQGGGNTAGAGVKTNGSATNFVVN